MDDDRQQQYQHRPHTSNGTEHDNMMYKINIPVVIATIPPVGSAKTIFEISDNLMT